MAQSVKLSDEVMAPVRRESALQSRSVAGQIAHWVRIGIAVERSGDFDYRRVRAALEASVAPEELSAEEFAVWADEFERATAETSPMEEEFFAKRRRLGLGVGLSDTGEIVRGETKA